MIGERKDAASLFSKETLRLGTNTSETLGERCAKKINKSSRTQSRASGRPKLSTTNKQLSKKNGGVYWAKWVKGEGKGGV